MECRRGRYAETSKEGCSRNYQGNRMRYRARGVQRLRGGRYDTEYRGVRRPENFIDAFAIIAYFDISSFHSLIIQSDDRRHRRQSRTDFRTSPLLVVNPSQASKLPDLVRAKLRSGQQPDAQRSRRDSDVQRYVLAIDSPVMACSESCNQSFSIPSLFENNARVPRSLQLLSATIS